VIVLFGAGGQLGQEIAALAGETGVEVAAFGRAQVDIADAAAVRAALGGVAGASLVVNAAAYTGVDAAESEPEAARLGNVEGPRVLARAAAAAGLPLVHVSTDYVFDGSKAGAYVESDPVAPLGVYGRTKAEGEEAVRAQNPRHLILRTSWVYGRYGRNILKTVLRLAGERDELRFVADQRGCPTSTRDLAEAILAVAPRLASGDAPWGTYHLAGTGATTWHGFVAQAVAEQARFTGRRPAVTAITTAEYPTPARRPANSELDSGAFAAAFGWRAPDWRGRVAETVAALAGQPIAARAS
jgi:dTDP-4-dehydrorhamnose reductase